MKFEWNQLREFSSGFIQLVNKFLYRTDKTQITTEHSTQKDN